MCFGVSLWTLKRGDWEGEGGAGTAFLHCRGRSSGSFSEFLQVKTEDELRHWVSAEHYGGLVSWPRALLLGEHGHQEAPSCGSSTPRVGDNQTQTKPLQGLCGQAPGQWWKYHQEALGRGAGDPGEELAGGWADSGGHLHVEVCCLGDTASSELQIRTQPRQHLDFGSVRP